MIQFEPIAILTNAELRMLEAEHASELFKLTDLNRTNLKEWLPWLDRNTNVEDSMQFIELQQRRAAANEALSAGIFFNQQLAGVMSFNEINPETRTGFIGYWLGREFQGRGLATLATRALVSFGFSQLGLERIEICCATGNFLSQKVPERLGFKKIGFRPKAEDLYGRLVDHFAYEMTRAEWSLNNSGTMYDQKEFFETYFRRATEKKIFIEALAARIKSKGGLNCDLSLLDLGAHDGSLLFNLLPKIASDFRSVEIFAVEPSAPSLQRLLAREYPSDCRVSGLAMTAEDFFASGDSNFDWAVASHCFYWSQDLAKVLGPLISRARESVVVLRGKTGIFQIQSQFRHLLGNKAEQLYHSDDIADSLDQMGIKYERQSVQTEIEIPELCDIRFKWLSAFFLQTTPDRLSDSELSEIYKFLDPQNGRIRHDVDFFWISNVEPGSSVKGPTPNKAID